VTWTVAGPIADRIGAVKIGREFLQLPSDRYEVRQKRVPVLRDHGGTFLGQLHHLEINTAGELKAVATVDGGLDADDLWFSPQVAYRDGGTDIELRELSLTRTPATSGLRPIRAFPGDFRNIWSRTRWNLGDDTRQMLERAAASAYGFGPLTIHGLAAPAQRSSTAAAPQLAPSAPIEYRSAGPDAVDVSTRNRLIDVLACPYREEASVIIDGRSVTEIVSNTAFIGVDRQQNRDRIKATREHRRELLFGRVVALDPLSPDGLHAEIKVSKTALGDETLELARDRLLDASIGFAIPRPDGERWEGRNRRRVVKAWLHEVSLVSEPAYAGAKVLGIRSDASRTPNLDAARAIQRQAALISAR
jgi:HK97 family phage prohead protease